MKKLHVICLMMSTVDGRIIAENWGENLEKFVGLYEKCHNSFQSRAWMVGRVTMEKDFTEGLAPDLKKNKTPNVRSPFIGDKNATSFAIAVDPKGKLGWSDNEIDGDHIIEILTEAASDYYLHFLQQKRISYIFAGKDHVDFKSAFGQLRELFPIKTLMLEGGGHINGSVLNEGLVDEISLLIIPMVDGSQKAPTSFEVSDSLHRTSATKLHLKEVEKLKNDVLVAQVCGEEKAMIIRPK